MSDVKSATNSTVSYFDFKIQTAEEEAKRAVCYSPKKRINFHQALLNKSPIKITSVRAGTKRFHSAGSEEYTLTKESKITPSSLPFQFNESFSNRLCTIKDAIAKDIFETIDLKAKVIKKDENKQQLISNEKAKYKCEAIIADETSSVKLVLWEDVIDQVHIGKTYHFEDLKVRCFDDVKFLNTNESTKIKPIDDIKVDLTLPEFKDNIVNGICIGVQLKRTNSCIVCNMTIDNTEDSEMITCKNCKVTTLSSVMNTKLVAQVMIKSEDNKLFRYACFNDAIQSLLTIKDNHTSLSDFEIEDLKKFILQSGTLKMIIDKSNQTVSQFLPFE